MFYPLWRYSAFPFHMFILYFIYPVFCFSLWYHSCLESNLSKSTISSLLVYCALFALSPLISHARNMSLLHQLRTPTSGSGRMIKGAVVFFFFSTSTSLDFGYLKMEFPEKIHSCCLEKFLYGELIYLCKRSNWFLRASQQLDSVDVGHERIGLTVNSYNIVP